MESEKGGEKSARKLATELHQMHCHAGDGKECLWDYETWESATEPESVRSKYLCKAYKLLKYFEGPEQVHLTLRCLRTVNPKIAYQLIEEL